MPGFPDVCLGSAAVRGSTGDAYKPGQAGVTIELEETGRYLSKHIHVAWASLDL